MLGLFALALFQPTRLRAQATERVNLAPIEPDSLFIHLGVGLAEPVQPAAFSKDWTTQVTMHAEAIYYRRAWHTLSLRLEYSTFDNDVEIVNDFPINAELTTVSFLAATSLTRRLRWGWPYVRLGAGLSRIRTRRAELDDGLVYRMGIQRQWKTGAGFTAATGWTIPLGTGVLLIPEFAYRADRVSRTWLGYGSLRIGLALSPSLLLGRLRGAPGR